jgi:hypothetical protein
MDEGDRSFVEVLNRMKYFSPTAKLLCAPMLLFAAAQSRAETTLYVGKHFEVRDHDQPTKYVFNGDTRIARITGSLSTNTAFSAFACTPAGISFLWRSAPPTSPALQWGHI